MLKHDMILLCFEILILCHWVSSQGCFDLWDQCALIKQYGQCSSFQSVCQRSCGNCPTNTGGDCTENTPFQCYQWFLNGQCIFPYVREVCPVSCGVCGGNGGGGTPTPKWSEWSEWETCSKECGGGTQSRSRTCSQPGQCSGSSLDSRDCNEQACSGDCTDNPLYYCYWQALSGHCNNPWIKRECPSSCGGCGGGGGSTPTWSQWSDWGTCSKECNVGTQSRSRTCSKPGQCSGSSMESRDCNKQACNGGDCTDNPQVRCSEHKEFGHCIYPSIKKDCPVSCETCEGSSDGEWSDWGPYDTCSETCGPGTKSRTRTCSIEGTCPGSDTETITCEIKQCSGVLGSWSSWTNCDVTCGQGMQESTRVCKGPGACEGDLKKTRTCNKPDCPDCNDVRTDCERRKGFQQCNFPSIRKVCRKTCGDCGDGGGGGDASWGTWTKWGDCDKTCGNGEQSRTRACSEPGQCTGDSEQSRQCNIKECTDDWSACSATCGDGTQKKGKSGQQVTRHCKNRDCDTASCPSGQEHRYKNPYACCAETSATGEWCNRPTASSRSFVRRIIGGENSELGQFPWMVYFEAPRVCGGALISEKYILTAAHCVQSDSGVRQDRITVYMGFVELYNSANRKQASVIKSIVHPDYRFPKNDIAILELKNKVQFTQNMRPICLPHGETVSYDSTCIAMGWGVSDLNNRAVTSILQNVDLKVLDPDVCIHGYTTSSVNTIRELGQFFKTKPPVLCVGDLKNEKDSCSGDSGSPLACQRCDSCGWFVAGVVSFGPEQCATKGIPGGYTDLAGYENWIYTTTGIPRKSRGC